MPNVNYRGNPSQDPNAPPESGMTSIPLGAPWPPLSREQVVKLREGLRTFTESFWEGYKADETHYAWADAAEGLFKVLDALNLTPRPPPTRTWTHEEVAKVAEEVQQRSGLPRHAEGRAPTTATELAITAAMESSQRLPQQQVEELLQFTADVPRRQDGQWEDPPKRNCWTCKHDFGFGHTDARYCRAMPARKRGERDSERHKAIGAWTNAQSLDATLMPPKDSDGCPGWERKP